jgi:hypothetical protein
MWGAKRCSWAPFIVPGRLVEGRGGEMVASGVGGASMVASGFGRGKELLGRGDYGVKVDQCGR